MPLIPIDIFYTFLYRKHPRLTLSHQRLAIKEWPTVLKGSMCKFAGDEIGRMRCVV